MIESINELLMKETGEQAVLAGLTVTRRLVAEPDGVWEEVRSWGDCQGWLCLTDRVAVITGTGDRVALDGGVILSGELTKGQESLHIRQEGAGWAIIHLIAKEDGDLLRTKDSFVSTEKGFLDYETYWRLEKSSTTGHSAYQPFAFRFAGIRKEGATDEP